jgi:hypothetical protein
MRPLSGGAGPTGTRLINRKSELNSSGLSILADGVWCSLQSQQTAMASAAAPHQQYDKCTCQTGAPARANR